MKAKPGDRMILDTLTVRCIIGTKPEERTNPQDVRIHVILECDLSAAGRSDRLADTVNYSSLRKRIVESVTAGRFQLIERMATAVANVCLEDRRVDAVTVRVEKPWVLPGLRSAAVEIRRVRGRVARKRRGRTP